MDAHDAQKTLRETLKDALRAKGISAAKLAELTEITPRYIHALIENDADHLPPAPYVRGYIKRIAEALDVDADTLWHQYQHNDDIERSGEKDLLPSNRFAHAKVNKKAIIITIVILIALVYLIPTIGSFFGRPSVTITNPSTNGQTTTSSSFFITGKVDDPKDKVLINGEEATVGTDGIFSKEVSLETGANTYTIVVHRFLGKDTTVVRTIQLDAPTPPAQTTSTTTTSSETSPALPASSSTGL